MTELEQIRHGYNDGQTIFRRQSVEVLLARIEELEADRAGILSVLSEMVDEAKLQDPFQDDTGLSLLHGAKMLLNKERKS